MTILGAELSPLSDSVPVIIEVYDLLSGKHDGTITPWAPIIVSGSRLDMYARDTVRLCLVSATDAKRVIEIGHIYKYSCNKVILALPELEPGGYVPAFKILQEDGSTLLQVLSVLWNVPDKCIKY